MPFNTLTRDGQPMRRDIRVIDIDPEEEIVPSRYTITAYGADYPVDGLVKRLESEDIVIPTFDPEVPVDEKHLGFQRQFVWTKAQCDRFIDSLLLGFPVPGIFLVKRDDGKLLVLDGQQRLRTLLAFYSGTLRGQEYSLERTQAKYRGKTYKTLDPEDRRRLDDSIIHATIVRQDEPSDDQSSIYLIFERLNTGGTALQPQEIRTALYQDGLVALLRELNEQEAWRTLYGRKSTRLKDQELILRFFALLFWSDRYARPMKDFLNRYLGKNRSFALQSRTDLEHTFLDTTGAILSAIGERAFRLKNAVNAAVVDSVMVGIATRLATKNRKPDSRKLKASYEKLIADNDYLDAVQRSTADEEKIRVRLKLARAAFTST